MRTITAKITVRLENDEDEYADTVAEEVLGDFLDPGLERESISDSAPPAGTPRANATADVCWCGHRWSSHNEHGCCWDDDCHCVHPRPGDSRTVVASSMARGDSAGLVEKYKARRRVDPNRAFNELYDAYALLAATYDEMCAERWAERQAQGAKVSK